MTVDTQTPMWEIDDPPVAVLKFGRDADMRDLLTRGHVYMNTLSYFKEREHGTPRGDPHEGSSYCWQKANGATLSMKRDDADEYVPVGTISGPIIWSDPDAQTANLYCLHARRRSDYHKVIDLTELRFGESAVLFLNFDEFRRRLTAAAGRTRHQVQWGLVHYVDRATYTGPMNAFTKFSEYTAQNELRFVLLPGSAEPLSLYLGDLSDIAILIDTAARYKLVPRTSAKEPRS